MVPSGPQNGLGSAQSMPSSLLRTNSGLLGAQAGPIPSQQPFPALVSPRAQFNGISISGNAMPLLSGISNVSSSLLNQSVGVISAQQLNSQLREPESVSFPSSNQIESDHSQPQQLNAVHNLSQQQLSGGLRNANAMPQVKLEPHIGSNDQTITGNQFQSLLGIDSVKIEPSSLQSPRSLGPMKLEHQHSESSLFLQHQRLQQLQQQQLFKALPQRTQLQLQNSLPIRPQMKPILYEPGMCARRLTQYMYHQQRRPEDNNIEFWRKYVSEFFALNAKKRWCVSLYGSGRQTTGVFPQDVWHCELCNRKPGRGFEATVEVLPRLLQIKYASGTLEELLYIDMPRESQNASGQIVLDYAKAVQESVFEHLRVVRDGQLRIVFNPDLKISSWEFCARRHEELIPRRFIIPQVSNLGTVVHKYQTASQNSSPGLSLQDLQNTCNSFVISARQLAKALEVPLVNDLGYTKRYVRCLQISEVVNSMKDLIDYSKDTGTGPMDSLINFPRRNSHSPGFHSQPQPRGIEQNILQTSSQNEQTSLSSHGGMNSSNISTSIANNYLSAPALTSTSGASIINLFHQNSMNSRQKNLMSSSSNSIYGGANFVQTSSAGSSNSIPASQPISSSSFLPTSTSYDTMIPIVQCSRINPATLPSNTQQLTTSQPHEADLPDSQSSMQQILQEIMFSSQPNNVSSNGNDMKSVNSIATNPNGWNCIVGNGIPSNQSNNSAVDCVGFGAMGGISSSAASSGLRASMANNYLTANRFETSHMSHDSSVINNRHQHDMENRLLASLGTVNSFNNMQFDWKPSP